MNQARARDQRFTPLSRVRTARPQATAFERSYLGTMEQVREVCADMTAITDGCALSDDLVLITSELATNAILHSRSGRSGRHVYRPGHALSGRLRLGRGH